MMRLPPPLQMLIIELFAMLGICCIVHHLENTSSSGAAATTVAIGEQTEISIFIASLLAVTAVSVSSINVTTEPPTRFAARPAPLAFLTA